MFVVSLPQAGHVLSDAMVLPSDIWTHMVQWLPGAPLITWPSPSSLPDTRENNINDAVMKLLVSTQKEKNSEELLWKCNGLFSGFRKQWGVASEV